MMIPNSKIISSPRFLCQEEEVDQGQEAGVGATQVVAKEMVRKIQNKKRDHIKSLIDQGGATTEAHNLKLEA